MLGVCLNVYTASKPRRTNRQEGRGIAQAVSRLPLTTEARFLPGSVYEGLVVESVALGHVFLRVLRVSLSISFHRGSSYSCILWGMNSSSEDDSLLGYSAV
jgi:hypothetical protein